MSSMYRTDENRVGTYNNEKYSVCVCVWVSIIKSYNNTNGIYVKNCTIITKTLEYVNH